MKSKIYDVGGKEKGTIELPKFFDTRVREDLVHKYFEADKFTQPYSPNERAGMRQNASGTISHKRQ